MWTGLIGEDSELILWVRAVATAILAGVVAKLVIFAPRALAAVPLWRRDRGYAAGVGAFAMFRQSVFAGVATGVLALVLGALASGG